MTRSDGYRTIVAMLSSSCRITFLLGLFLAIPITLDDTHSAVLEVAEADDTMTASLGDAWLYGRAGDHVFDSKAIEGRNICGNWTDLKDDALSGFRILPVETYLRCLFAEVLRHDLGIELRGEFFPNTRGRRSNGFSSGKGLTGSTAALGPCAGNLRGD